VIHHSGDHSGSIKLHDFRKAESVPTENAIQVVPFKSVNKEDASVEDGILMSLPERDNEHFPG
jgi:hypothetical protein